MKRTKAATGKVAAHVAVRLSILAAAAFWPAVAMAEPQDAPLDYGDISIKGFPDAAASTSARPSGNRDTVRTFEVQRSPSASAEYGITGDWGGVRTDLGDKGFTISGDYIGQTAYLARGGERHGTTFVGLGILGVTADLERLVGDPGGSVQVTLTHLHGKNLEASTGLQTAGPVQGNWGRGTVGRLTALVYTKKVGENFSFTVGRTPFIAFDTFSCAFLNVAFCATQAGHNQYEYIYNPPVSMWAAWARVGSTRRAYFQFGAYVSEPKNLKADRPFEFGNFSSSTGVLLPLELGVFPEIGRNQLPGSYKIGGWVETSTTKDIILNADRQPVAVAGGTPLATKGRHGFYLVAVQQIARFGRIEDNRGATVFVNAMQADKRTSFLQREISFGTFIKGLFAPRPNDTIGIGYATTRINPRLAQIQALVGDPVQTSERVIEFYYGAQAFRGVVLQPGVQFLHRPAGLKSGGNPIVVGLKTAISL